MGTHIVMAGTGLALPQRSIRQGVYPLVPQKSRSLYR